MQESESPVFATPIGVALLKYERLLISAWQADGDLATRDFPSRALEDKCRAKFAAADEARAELVALLPVAAIVEAHDVGKLGAR